MTFLIAPFTLFSIKKVVMSMYAIKFFHGYLTADGKRTRDKSGCLVYHSEKEAQKLADKIGGRVKKIG
ncbi:hypothetical protein GTI64_02800 [Enterococcus faecalis]|nr:hypothetical protein [Enterococcus faecalis]